MNSDDLLMFKIVDDVWQNYCGGASRDEENTLSRPSD